MSLKALFKGQTFAVSGKLAQPQKEYENLVVKHGGAFASSVSATVTFLITTEADVKALSSKVAAAKGRGVPMVNEGFIGACIVAKKLLDFDKFLIAARKRKPTAGKAKAKVAPAKKAKVVAIASDSVVITKSSLADKAYVVEEDVSKGFMKAKLTWDVELVLTDAATGKDKYYNMQVLASKAGAPEFWAVQHWGSTGKDGRAKVDGPFSDVAQAQRVFKRKYRSKTGRPFGQLGASCDEISGKYRHIGKSNPAAGAAGPGRWQYYLHNVVDGKAIGWYDYDESFTGNMEKYWRQSESNDGLAVRVLRSDYFSYEVDYKHMLQTNLTSGTRRVIRRIAPGTDSSDEAPTVIPTKVKPRALLPDDDDEDDAEPEDDADYEDDAADAEDDGEAEAAAEEPAASVGADEAETLVLPAAGGGRKADAAASESGRKAAAVGADEADTEDEAPARR